MGVQPGPGRSQRKSKRRPWDGDIQKLEHLGHGVSGMVLAIDERRVAKIDTGSPRSIEDITTEREVYRKLNEGHCSYVLKCYEIDNLSGLVLERCNDTVRSCLKSKYRNSPPPEEVVKKWACEAAQGLAYIHRKRIVQGDVGCHNMLLSSDNTLKLADFAGSSINGSPSTVNYEVRSRSPGVDEPNELSDIFALGSAIWEMATGSPPYQDKPWREVRGLYKRGKFPKLKSIPELGNIIRKCWEQSSQQSYKSAQEVVDDIEGLFPQFDTGNLNSDSSQTLVGSDTSLRTAFDREPPDKYQYVNRATTKHGHKSRLHDIESERWNEKPEKYGSKQKEKKKKSEKRTGLLDWLRPSYTYRIRA